MFLVRVAVGLAVLSTGFSCAVAQTNSGASSGANAGVASNLPAYDSDPKFKDAWAEAKHLEARKQLSFAADAYKKANKIAGGKCIECLQGMFHAQMDSGDFKAAVNTAGELEGVVDTPVWKSMAQAERGWALLAQGGDKPKPAQLEAAHAAFQQALQTNPKNALALYQDGVVLAREGKTEEAQSTFDQCAKCMSPRDPALLRVKHFAENPELATHKMAPPFVVTALDGSRFNLDAMGGRVVLIDFWATWCGPCNEELPHMKELAKKFAGQPLVIISVSWDADEAKWKQFIDQHEMTWVQYRDADHKLSEAYGVNAIPHYFTIDSDGVLTSEMLGEGSDVEGKLKKLLAKANEEIQQRNAAKGAVSGQ
jgi:thiol-disulfide isomerase/thioredoxin